MLHKFSNVAQSTSDSDKKDKTISAAVRMAEDILAEMAQGSLRTVSVSTNRAYLNALLVTKRFDEYFNTGIEMMVTYASYDYGRQVGTHMERVGLVRYKRFMDHSSKSMDSIKVNYTRLSGVDLNDIGLHLVMTARMLFSVIKFQPDHGSATFNKGSSTALHSHKQADSTTDLSTFANPLLVPALIQWSQAIMNAFRTLSQDFLVYVQQQINQNNSSTVDAYMLPVQRTMTSLTDIVSFYNNRASYGTTPSLQVNGQEPLTSPTENKSMFNSRQSRPRSDSAASEMGANLNASSTNSLMGPGWNVMYVVGEVSGVCEKLRLVIEKLQRH